MKPINQIIKERRLSLGMTMKQLSIKVGVSEGTISRWESGEIKNMRRSAIASLAEALQLPPAVIMGWRDETGQETSSSKANISLPDSPILYSYPYFDDGISAGALENCEAIDGITKIDVPDLLMGKYARNPDIVFMHVNGESMNHVIEDGALIAVLRLTDRYMYRNGDIVIATNGRDYTVKRMYDDPAHRQLILNPDSTNPEFQPIVVPYDSEDTYQLYGKVVIYSVIL